MYLVVGLGNPGKKYVKTRHNVGFEVVERIASERGFAAWKTSGNAEVSRGTIAGHDVLLAKPQTFMNLSGDAVGALLRFYKIEPANLVVVHDELDYELARLGVKSGGGHGGHNGLRSIMAHVGRDFVRVRIGVGKPVSKEEGADHVLSRFDKGEESRVDEAVAKASEAVAKVIEKGVQAAMNEFNRRNEATA
jgi:peptidyl-tRNA hydrolase, PTH1 family